MNQHFAFKKTKHVKKKTTYQPFLHGLNQKRFARAMFKCPKTNPSWLMLDHEFKKILRLPSTSSCFNGQCMILSQSDSQSEYEWFCWVDSVWKCLALQLVARQDFSKGRGGGARLFLEAVQTSKRMEISHDIPSREISTRWGPLPVASRVMTPQKWCYKL